MGPLALMAAEAGLEVCGSDLQESAVTDELRAKGIEFRIGMQDGSFLQEKIEAGAVDWVVHSSAVSQEHRELDLAREANLRVSKRDELIAYLVERLGLKMVAVAGTHGKTTTTAMIVWTCERLALPISYLVGSNLPFVKMAGHYESGSEFIIYEADEYDKNFLQFSPWLAVLTAVTFDHPDIYQDEADYKRAFLQFVGQSEEVVMAPKVNLGARGVLDKAKKIELVPEIKLAGEARRIDASLALVAVERIAEELGRKVEKAELAAILNDFPGVRRRFEQIAPGVYSDYAHHPEEVEATVAMAREEAARTGRKGVVAVYEPHQNTRQWQVREGYKRAFLGVEKLFWLPTFLTREDKSLAVIQPEEFVREINAGLDKEPAAKLHEQTMAEAARPAVAETEMTEGAEGLAAGKAEVAEVEVAEAAETGQELAERLQKYVEAGYLVLLMTAGPADDWLRQEFAVK